MSNKLKIATASSTITQDVHINGAHIRQLMTEARANGAQLIHFPEAALSGYVKSQIHDWDQVDWSGLRSELEAIAAHAGQIGIWTVLGCNHRLPAANRPHNSLYVISAEGRLIDRYDKRFCSHSEVSDWYTPGTRAVVFDVDGFKFGVALCIELHFPELFAEYEQLGVDCVLVSAYSNDAMFGIEAQAHATTNNYWLSLSTPAQCSPKLPSGLIGPDGYYVSQAPDESARLVYGVLDRTDPRFEVALTKARPWRTAARAGDIHTPYYVNDALSEDRTSFFEA